MDSELLERLPAPIGELGQRLHQEVMKGVGRLDLASLKLRLRIRLGALQKRGLARAEYRGGKAWLWEAVRS